MEKKVIAVGKKIFFWYFGNMNFYRDLSNESSMMLNE